MLVKRILRKHCYAQLGDPARGRTRVEQQRNRNGRFVGPMISIYCALEATLKGERYTPTDEKDSDHLARCHPDPVAAQARRKELERLVDERIRKDGQS